MVYDCFTFFNEFDILEMRLNILKNVVDKFVLVEATQTHQGKDKPLYYSQNKARYKEFEDRIIHIVVDKFPSVETNLSWTLERYQRDKIMEGLKDAGQDDTILVSDVDEIPNPQQVKAYMDKPGIKVFSQQGYFYFINCRNITDNQNNQWCGTVMTKYSPKLTPQLLRFISIYVAGAQVKRILPKVFCKLKVAWWIITLGRNIYKVENGGWHFSYLGGVQMIIKKLESFAHSEYNKEEFKNPDKINEAINNGEDIFGRNFRYKIVPLDGTFPDFIRENREKYKDLIR